MEHFIASSETETENYHDKKNGRYLDREAAISLVVIPFVSGQIPDTVSYTTPKIPSRL